MAKAKEKKGYQGPKLDGDNSEYRKKRAAKNAQSVERQSNDGFALENQEFKDACSKAGVPATPRQASKFRNGYGKAAWAAGKSNRKHPVEA